MLGYDTNKTWFSHLLRHLAIKQERFYLYNPRAHTVSNPLEFCRKGVFTSCESLSRMYERHRRQTEQCQ